MTGEGMTATGRRLVSNNRRRIAGDSCLGIVGKAAKYIAVLGVALAVVSALAGAVAARRYGNGAYEASAVAAFLNWIAGSVSLAIMVVTRNKPWRTHGALLAAAGRMVLPLAALMVFSRSQHSLAAHGVAGLIVLHYLVGLVIETVLSLRLVATAMSASTPAAVTSDT